MILRSMHIGRQPGMPIPGLRVKIRLRVLTRSPGIGAPAFLILKAVNGRGDASLAVHKGFAGKAVHRHHRRVA